MAETKFAMTKSKFLSKMEKFLFSQGISDEQGVRNRGVSDSPRYPHFS